MKETKAELTYKIKQNKKEILGKTQAGTKILG